MLLDLQHIVVDHSTNFAISYSVLVEFGEWLCGEVVKDVPHRHIVFSIPRIPRRCFLYDRKRLTDLSRCALETLKAYFTFCERHRDARPGAVIAIQTFGDLLG